MTAKELRTTFYVGRDQSVMGSPTRVFDHLNKVVAWVAGYPRSRVAWLLTLQDGGHNPPFYTTTKLKFIPAVPADLVPEGQEYDEDDSTLGYCSSSGSAGLTLHPRRKDCVNWMRQRPNVEAGMSITGGWISPARVDVNDAITKLPDEGDGD